MSKSDTAVVAAGTVYRTRRDERRERTHERLLDAALDLIRWKGVSAVSVSEVTKRVGVHHSLFYTHFPTIDDCLAAAANRVVKHLVPVDVEVRQRYWQRGVFDRDQFAKTFEDSFERWLGERSFLELLLAHRFDRSALGAALQPTYARVREETAAELWTLFSRSGVHPSHMPAVQLLADMNLDTWAWAMNVLLEGRCTDHTLISRMLADSLTSNFRNTLARIRSIDPR